MNNHVRGNIEHMIDEIMEEISLYNRDIRWVFDSDFSSESSKPDFLKLVSSKSDFLFGYILGRINSQAWPVMVEGSAETEEDFEELENIIKRRLPEIQGNIAAALNV